MHAEPPDSDHHDPGNGEGTPRWVKAFAVFGAAVLILLTILLATGGHGPGRHSLPPLPPGITHAQR